MAVLLVTTTCLVFWPNHNAPYFQGLYYSYSPITPQLSVADDAEMLQTRIQTVEVKPRASRDATQDELVPAVGVVS